MANNPIDPIHQKIILGTSYSAVRAAERAQQTGTPLVVWRDNHVVEIDAADFIQQQADSSKKP